MRTCARACVCVRVREKGREIFINEERLRYKVEKSREMRADVDALNLNVNAAKLSS